MISKAFGKSKSTISQDQTRLFTDITVPVNIVSSVTKTKNKSSMPFGKLLASLALAGLVLVFPFTALADDQTPATPTDQTTTQAPTDTTTTTPTDQTTTQTPTDTTTTTPTDQPTTPPTTSTTVAPSNTQPTTGPTQTTGPQSPTGADAKTYTFNKDTGLWENAYYTWNPKTGQTAPKSTPQYYFDPTTKTWSTDKWTYSPEAGKYVAVATPVGPVLANQLANGMGGAGNNASLIDPLLASILGTGPGSSNDISNNNQSTGFFDLFSKAAITNNLNSTATSGNATVSGNTLAGSALSGDASAMSNVINAINSVLGLFTRPVTTYLKNIYGSVTGDISLNPNALATAGTNNGSSSVGDTGPNSSNTINSDNGVKTTLNAQSQGSIVNNVDLNAKSGDASVTKNTQGGDATSGMATAVTNIMNLINSSISSGNSFLGMINIFGDYNGNILFPPGFLDSVMAQIGSSNNPGSNSVATTGPNSNNLINNNTDNTTNVNNTASNTINNNVNLAAQSGQAGVTGNTVGGNATSGNANSNLTLINMTGQNVIAKNAFLVVVNVLGHWVGMIMNAPTGATSAVLGSGASSNSVNQTGPNSNNQINGTTSTDTTINNTANNSITNNVNVAAQSGDANVSGNTRGGNATTGDAKVAANIVNISNSNLSLSDWFGVLFINVFGNWIGNVGGGNSDTSATTQSSTTGSGSAGNSSHVIVFVPKNATTKQSNGVSLGGNSSGTTAVMSANSPTGGNNSLLNGSNVGNSVGKTALAVKTSITKNLGVTFMLFGVALALFIAERILYIRKRRMVARSKVLL